MLLTSQVKTTKQENLERQQKMYVNYLIKKPLGYGKKIAWIIKFVKYLMTQLLMMKGLYMLDMMKKHKILSMR